LTYPARSRATEPGRSITLEWRAPSGCPDEAWARAAIDAYLGPRKVDAFKPIAVRVAIASVPGGRWRAELSMSGGASGDRVFEGASCARVGDAAVLIVALMLDPVEVVTQIDSPRAEAPRATGGSAPEGRRAAEGRPPSRIELAVQATGDVGSLPAPSVGFGLAGGVRVGRALVAADIVAWVPRRAIGGPTVASGGEIGLYTASLRGCLRVAGGLDSGLALEPCMRAEGGLAVGRGFGIAEPATARSPWGAAFAGLTVRQVSSESLGAWLSVEAGVPFVRPHYVIEEFGTVFQAGPVLARVSFGLAWSFP
jgi:hypothetical protein